jgi:hypothetical protein
LAGQGSGGLGLVVWVVGIGGVKSHLRAEPVEPVEQGIREPLWCGQSRPQDTEDGMILVLLLCNFAYQLVYNIGLCVAEEKY